MSDKDANLFGIRQFVVRVDHHPKDTVMYARKHAALLHLLKTQSFSQCMAFACYQTRAEALARDFDSIGWPSSCLAGHLDQRTRLK